MKKKVLSLALVVVLALVAIGSVTLAYFNDTETATNTFTFGKVDIVLNEKDNNGNDFEPDQKLLPGSNSSNAIAKNVTVTVEDDSEEAWVWVEILIPAELYSSKTESNENNNALHYNQFIDYLQGYEKRSSNVNAQAVADRYFDDHQWSILKYIEEVEVDGVTYSLLRTTHKDIVKAGVTTSPALNQVYMDDDVYEDGGKMMIPADGKEAGHATKFVAYEGDWEIIVNAYAVQAAGIADVDAAVLAFGAQNVAETEAPSNEPS